MFAYATHCAAHSIPALVPQVEGRDAGKHDAPCLRSLLPGTELRSCLPFPCNLLLPARPPAHAQAAYRFCARADDMICPL